MSEDTPSIWIKFPRPGKKPFILGAYYREHKLLNEVQPNITGDPRLQRSRWKKFLLQWASQKDGEEVAVAGDLNLDHLKWETPEQKHLYMIEDTKNLIETKGFTQQVEGATRFWIDTTPSLLDHFWMNNPAGIISCKNHLRPVADHNLMETSLRMKGSMINIQESLKRKWKNLDLDKFKQRIQNQDWENIYEIQDPNIAYDFLETRMKSALDEQIPIVKVQPSGRRASWVTSRTKEIIKIRDAAKIKARQSNSEDDWKLYRTNRNKVTEMIKQDKKNYFTEMYKQAEENKDVKNLFRISKEQLGWESGGPRQYNEQLF